VFSITFGHEQWYILYYYYGKKKSAGLHFWACGEHASGYHVTSDHVTSCDVIFGQSLSLGYSPLGVILVVRGVV
jgi:hypothetical protein